jgi:hypothetical protein
MSGLHNRVVTGDWMNERFGVMKRRTAKKEHQARAKEVGGKG